MTGLASRHAGGKPFSARGRPHRRRDRLPARLLVPAELRIELDPAVEAPPALAPLIDPNFHSCGTVPPHGIEELVHPETGLLYRRLEILRPRADLPDGDRIRAGPFGGRRDRWRTAADPHPANRLALYVRFPSACRVHLRQVDARCGAPRRLASERIRRQRVLRL